MKKIVLSLMLAAPLTASYSLGQEKVTSVKAVSVVGTAVQKDLQDLYLALKKSTEDKDSKAVKEIMTGLQAYNVKLNDLTYAARENNQFTKKKWQALDESLNVIERLASINVSALDRGSRNSINTWMKTAKSFGAESEKYAVLSTSQSAATNSILVAGVVNGNTNLVVEDRSLGLDTPEDRVEFVEWLTRVRADENRVLARGGFTTPGGTTNRFPAAYVYSNGSPGNTTSLGRRDTLTPIFNNGRTQTRRRVSPPVQIRIGR